MSATERAAEETTGRRDPKRTRLRARALASGLGLTLPLAAACATTAEGPPSTSNPDASSGSSHDAPPGSLGDTSTTAETGGGSSGSSSGGSSGSDGGSGSGSGGVPDSGIAPVDSSVPVSHPCTSNATLPYAVDGTTGVDGATTQTAFISSGYEGDYCAVSMTGTNGACPGHAMSGAVGKCWSATVFQPAAPCPNYPFVQGWAGVEWQYPENNWTDPSTMGGLNLCGATKVSFWAAGATGTESVNFFAGNVGYSVGLMNQTLSKTWTHYTLTLSGMPDSNVSVGFGWTTTEPTGDGGAGITEAGPGAPDAGAPDASTPDASTPDASTPDASTPDASTPDASTGPSVKFMVDDIEWQ